VTIGLRIVVPALAWFACINLIASVIALALARLIRQRSGSRQPALLLMIRLFPAAASTMFVCGLFLPVHWALEPREIVESFGFAWYVLAIAGSALLARAAVRMTAIAGRSHRFTRDARVRFGDADPIEVDSLPGVSLAGTLRPRILIGTNVKTALSSAELDVAVAHEVAHRDAFDNLARWLMLCAPDFLGLFQAASRLEHDWHVAAEARADAAAIRGDQRRAVNLASALIKVARLSSASPHRSAVPSWSTLNDSEILEWRVGRLLSGGAPQVASGVGWLPLIGACGLSLMLATMLFGESIHRLTELLVTALP
jgi:hypothetical protein